MKKFMDRVERLSNKIRMSQTPVPGFIMGLSGTDSIVAFIMCYDAMAKHGKANRVLGIHYVNGPQQLSNDYIKSHGWFIRDIIPWLRKRCPEATFRAVTPRGGNQDQQRWADLHLRALNRIEYVDHIYNGVSDSERTISLDVENSHSDVSSRERIVALDEEDTYWVVGTINATEKALGRYSLLASAVSVQPLMTMYKSDIIHACEYLGVPQIAIEKSRLPDCLCGRDELAANNVELIDDILRFKADVTAHDPQLLKKLYDYVNESQSIYGFKQRIPYLI